jgi:hypothetical protein
MAAAVSGYARGKNGMVVARHELPGGVTILILRPVDRLSRTPRVTTLGLNRTDAVSAPSRWTRGPDR